MKHFIYNSLLVIFLLTFVGCIPKDDDSTGGGTPDIVAKFLGTWHVTDSKAKLNYDVTIERDVLSNTKVVLKNFAGVGGQVKGDVVGNAVVIDSQPVSGYTIEGTGSYKNNKELNFTYLLSDGIDQEMRDAQFVK